VDVDDVIGTHAHSLIEKMVFFELNFFRSLPVFCSLFNALHPRNPLIPFGPSSSFYHESSASLHLMPSYTPPSTHGMTASRSSRIHPCRRCYVPDYIYIILYKYIYCNIYVCIYMPSVNVRSPTWIPAAGAANCRAFALKYHYFGRTTGESVSP
jgi:hypothetical protein